MNHSTETALLKSHQGHFDEYELSANCPCCSVRLERSFRHSRPHHTSAKASIFIWNYWHTIGMVYLVFDDTWYLTTSCLYLQNSLWYFSSWLRCSIRVLSWSSIVHHLFLQILWYTWTAPPKCLLLCWRLSAVSCLNVSLMNRKVGMMP